MQLTKLGWATAVASLMAVVLSASALAATPQPFRPGYPSPSGPGTATSWFPGQARHAASPHASLPSSKSWFPWYDNASPGFTADYIHVVNPSGSAVSGSISLPGAAAIPFSLNPGAEGHYAFPPGTRGGPVTVDAGTGQIVSSQRVTYLNSFNELPALSAADANTTFWLTWYDNASDGMLSDNVHVLNPGASAVSVSVRVGTRTPLSATLQPGAGTYFSYPHGTIGGPVFVSSAGGPVLVTKRVAFGASFSEIPATPQPSAGGPVYLGWYDNSSWGFLNDNVHVVNAGVTATDVTVTVAGRSQTISGLQPGSGSYTNFPGVLGGPVVITAAQPVVASQRFLYHGDFVEQPALPASAATSTTWLPWYDTASTGISDDIHVTNVDPATAATVNLFFPGRNPVTLNVSPGQDAYYGYPGGTIGGPVQVAVASGPSVIVSVRSFIYIPPPPPPPPVPQRHILVSLSQQHLWAYNGDQLFLETDVTTGRPELPTPPGHYTIFDKRSPYKFVSPWPYGSPYWYPDAWVNWAMEFIQGGYYLHDAPWRSWYGPGSNYGDGTHGCVNVPHDPMQSLYNWAQNGDIVDVVN